MPGLSTHRKPNQDIRFFFDIFIHTLYLSFFLHGQNLGRNLSPHRKCVNRDKTGLATTSMNCNKRDFATKQHEFHQKRSHDKTV